MPQGKSKYRNVRCVVQGEKFDSQREADHWLGLLARQAAGEITHLRRQVRFPLYTIVMNSPATAPKVLQVADYIADFVYLDSAGLQVVEDAKGRRICPYPLKKKWLYLQDGIEIVEV